MLGIRATLPKGIFIATSPDSRLKGMKVKLWRSVADRIIKGINKERWSEEIVGWTADELELERPPIEKTYLVTDEYGVVKGCTTHNIQKLLAVNPEWFSPDAGIIAGWAIAPHKEKAEPI